MTVQENIRAALFDLDGVVFDTESQYSVFWGEQCRLYHPDKPGLEDKIKGQTLVQIFDKYFSELKGEQPVIVRRLDEFERNMKFEYVPGFLDFVTALRGKGVKTAVVTSSNQEKMKSVFHLKSLVTMLRVDKVNSTPCDFMSATLAYFVIWPPTPIVLMMPIKS